MESVQIPNYGWLYIHIYIYHIPLNTHKKKKKTSQMLHGARIFTCIYIHLPQTWPSFVGKYSSAMEHLGI